LRGGERPRRATDTYQDHARKNSSQADTWAYARSGRTANCAWHHTAGDFSIQSPANPSGSARLVPALSIILHSAHPSTLDAAILGHGVFLLDTIRQGSRGEMVLHHGYRMAVLPVFVTNAAMTSTRCPQRLLLLRNAAADHAFTCQQLADVSLRRKPGTTLCQRHTVISSWFPCRRAQHLDDCQSSPPGIYHRVLHSPPPPAGGKCVNIEVLPYSSGHSSCEEQKPPDRESDHSMLAWCSRVPDTRISLLDILFRRRFLRFLSSISIYTSSAAFLRLCHCWLPQ
jgi:hypothetical protein